MGPINAGLVFLIVAIACAAACVLASDEMALKLAAALKARVEGNRAFREARAKEIERLYKEYDLQPRELLNS